MLQAESLRVRGYPILINLPDVLCHWTSFPSSVADALPVLCIFPICCGGCPPSTMRLSHMPWWVLSRYCTSFTSAVADALLILYVFRIYRGGCPPSTVHLFHLPWRMPSWYYTSLTFTVSDALLVLCIFASAVVGALPVLCVFPICRGGCPPATGS